MELYDKITKLKKEGGFGNESLKQINEWQDRVPELLALLDYINHPYSKKKKADAISEMQGIDEKILNDRRMSEVDRNYLYGVKETLKREIDFLSQEPQAELELIESQVAAEL